ncbi:MAG TPA: CBS domain-containing protein [Methylomirabilota bacterium]|nr:CBS domain-containing protein [Methylomirabilota bacterium]
MSVKLGKIMGIPVRIHYTLWLVFILIAWSLAYGYMPRQYPGLSTLTYWGIGIGSAIILFGSILIHELSHSYVAKRHGLPIARITLFFFGGVSEMTEEPQDPGLEVKMAIAGPLMSFLIAGILGGAWYMSEITKTLVPITAMLGYGALINGILGVFNLIPAFPLDGGRVFRGSLWKRSGNLIGATKVATRISEILSLLMMFGGFILIIVSDFVDGLWIVVLGWFIKSGAETSLRQTLIGETLSGVTVSDLMTRNVYTISPDITVDQLVSDYFLVNRHQGYPVVRDGKILGVVTLQSVRSIPKDLRSSTKVEQAISHGEPPICVKPTLSALDAMHKMVREKVGRLLVMEDGSLVGIVTRGDLMRIIQTRQELGAVHQTSTATPTVPQIKTPRDQTARCVQCGGQVLMGSRFCPHCGALQNI